MKDGAVLSNAGHFDIEINKVELMEMTESVKTVRENIEEYRLKDGRRIYLLGRRPFGQSRLRFWDIRGNHGYVFCGYKPLLFYLKDQGRNLPHAVNPVPSEVDKDVASYKLASLGKKSMF